MPSEYLAQLRRVEAQLSQLGAASRFPSNAYEYYDGSRVGGYSWIWYSTHPQGIDVYFNASVQCLWASGIPVKAVSDLKAISQTVTYWRLDQITIASGWGYASGYQEHLHTGSTGSLFTMGTKHTCREGFGDTYFKTSSATMNY